MNHAQGPKNGKKRKLLLIIRGYNTALPGKQADILTMGF